MGFMPSLLGVGSTASSSGANFRASGVPLDRAVTTQQTTDAYNQAQQALQQQQSFAQALQGQGGIQNQSNVYNQYANLAAGNGPSLAQTQLNQATGANVSNQAALMAGQRGAGANVGLMARQAGQQGAATQQQAVGQAAQLRAGEQLGALGQMQGIAGQQVGQQANATNAYTAGTQNEQQNLLNSMSAYNNANVGMQSNMNNANAGVAQQMIGAQSNLMGNLMGGAGKGAAMADGGMISSYAGGGDVSSPSSDESFLSQYSRLFGSPQNMGGSNMQPSIGVTPGAAGGFKHADFGLNKSRPTPTTYSPNAYDAAHPGAMAGGPMDAGSMSSGMMNVAKGGKVPAMVSPGEVYLPPKKVKEVEKGKADPIKDGKKIPGKAKVKGDHEINDTVPATLEEGGIVIPKSIMESKNPPKEAHKFIQAILNKNKLKKKN